MSDVTGPGVIETPDLAAVLERVAELEAKLAEKDATGQLDPDYVITPEGLRHRDSSERTFANFQLRPELTATTPFYALVGSDLPRDVRELRRLVAAIAIARDEPVPGSAVPKDYVPLLKRLYAVRQRGLPWRAALVEVGLEPPDDVVVGFRARALADELPALWDSLRPVIAALNPKNPPVAGKIALERVKSLMAPI